MNLNVKCCKTNHIPVFCQFLLDQPTLSKHQKVYRRTRLHPNLSNEWEDDRPKSRCVLAAPAVVTPITVSPKHSVIPKQIGKNNRKIKEENV